MKLIHALPALLISLSACQETKPPAHETAPDDALAPQPWAGLYADTLPCADCPGILTQLDLRADSTYVMRDLYLDRDSIPYGTIGRWTVSGDVLTLITADVPMRWARTEGRLERRQPDGTPIRTSLPNSIGPVAHFSASPMRLTGGYVYYADSHNFTPCGSEFIIPVAMDEAGVEGAGLALERAYGERVATPPDPLYVEVVATLRIGPAMEGDGTDEYLYIERLERVKEVQECP